jgi:uncharacterized SAM-binding protein YcdF (DUF218 family)
VLTILKAISGTLHLLALCCAVGLLLRIAGFRRAARSWLFVTYLTFVIGGIPAVAHQLASGIPAAAPMLDVGPFANTDVLVVLDGDNPDGRIREAAAIVRAAHPRIVVVSGPSVLADRLAAEGVPLNRLVMETEAGTTREQIAFAGQFIHQAHALTPTLVVSCLSVARVEGLLRKARLDIRVAGSDFDEPVPEHGYRRWLPSFRSLSLSRYSLYEILALRYYRSKGWLEPVAAGRRIAGSRRLRKKVSFRDVFSRLQSCNRSEND